MESVSNLQTCCESFRFTSSLRPPMLRMSTKAASPCLPDIITAAWLIVTITYCSGLPIVAATALEREVRSCFCVSSERSTVVSSFRRGMRESKQKSRCLPRNVFLLSFWVSELIERAAGKDVFAQTRTKRLAMESVVSPEMVCGRDPEIILASWCGRPVSIADIRGRGGWNKIAAVRHEHIYE